MKFFLLYCVYELYYSGNFKAMFYWLVSEVQYKKKQVQTALISSILHAINLSENRISHTNRTKNTDAFDDLGRKKQQFTCSFFVCVHAVFCNLPVGQTKLKCALFEYNHSQVAVIRKQMIISFRFSNTF